MENSTFLFQLGRAVSQREWQRSEAVHICHAVKDRRKQPWNVIKKKSMHLRVHLKSYISNRIIFFLFGFLGEKVLDEQMLRCRAERSSVFLLFFLFPLEWLQGWLPGFGLAFLDSDAPIKALDLGLMVRLTSWWPEPGRSGPERAGFSWKWLRSGWILYVDM